MSWWQAIVAGCLLVNLLVLLWVFWPRRRKARTMLMADWCPFLTCSLPVPHRHEICPECQAVRYGNLFCKTCQTVGLAVRIMEEGRGHHA